MQGNIGWRFARWGTVLIALLGFAYAVYVLVDWLSAL
jgi:hypothetical protein